MIINGASLFALQPIKHMMAAKLPSLGGVTYGLGEAGYDIRIKQTLFFNPNYQPLGGPVIQELDEYENIVRIAEGRFTLASAIEEFHMPANLCAEVKDKSTWARQGISVFNTVIENAWNGYLTLELVFHGNKPVLIPAGSGIAQVLFYQTSDERFYSGRYQQQEDKPVPAKLLSRPE